MPELLTLQIAKEYVEKVAKLPYNGLQDIGKRRELRIELQNRCGLTELQAVNIINGRHIQDYIAIHERRFEEECAE